jgi:hypothetical protein
MEHRSAGKLRIVWNINFCAKEPSIAHVTGNPCISTTSPASLNTPSAPIHPAKVRRYSMEVVGRGGRETSGGESIDLTYVEVFGVWLSRAILN